MAELLLSGCTTTTDHHYVFPPGLEDAIDIEVAAAKRLGIRAVLTRGSMNLSQRDGGLPPDSVVQDEDTILADSERLVDRHHRARRRRDGADRAGALLAVLGHHIADAVDGRARRATGGAGCTPISPRPRTRTAIATKSTAAARSTIWRIAAGSASGPGWRMASISTQAKSRGSAGRGPRSATARAAIRCSPPAAVRSAIWKQPA